MRFDPPLLPGTLVRRYKRFLADVVLADGVTVTAHSPNTGSMMNCQTPGSRVWLSQNDDPRRKLRYTWELASDGDVVVGVHTGRTNRLAEAVIAAGGLPALAGYDRIRREVKVGERSRLDLVLERERQGGGPAGGPAGGAVERCYVEVKNVTLTDAGVALFPDAVTVRGAKHLAELERLVAAGHRAAMVYVVQRPDADRVRAAAAIDPVYAAALSTAVAAGVEAYGLRFRPNPEGIPFEVVLPVEV